MLCIHATVYPGRCALTVVALSSSPRRYFTLKVETCSSGTGRFLGILFWVLMICFILYVVSRG